ncbi:glycoside hydrolase family 43 protein [Acidiferrimicrobium sp. IK]|uniref:glycoside hydrolase family 43 protein n=1 Tax=Acidiferrimicrobium sp. IK TaxID=2871700 RepID=UPI0021CB38F9|nr:glycoside hydrolase family 43 protein [Acidiferrimicrobium sp. IK]MCU4183219.1 glycoside hydrolase family 43 protein [Acidiferrimicrobium sp. IK]
MVVTVAALLSLVASRSAHGRVPPPGTRLALSGGGLPASGLPVLGPARVVETDDVGDPYVLTVPKGQAGNASTTYVLYWTTDWRSNVPTAVSSDLVHWRRVADSLPRLPSWAVDSRTMTWGPTVAHIGREWVLYFSTLDRASRLECIGRATSESPTGPFTDSSPGPLVCQPSLGGDIDPSVVAGPGGGRSLLWKNDGNSLDVPVAIWQQPLTSDGLSLQGRATRLLSAVQPWEHGIIEGPAMLRAGTGGWWLFYSGGTWQSASYGTGVAWCATPAGPCRAAKDSAVLASTPTAVSPGGFDTFVDGSGKLWASYSAFPAAPADAADAMRMNRVLEIAPILAH